MMSPTLVIFEVSSHTELEAVTGTRLWRHVNSVSYNHCFAQYNCLHNIAIKVASSSMWPLGDHKK